MLSLENVSLVGSSLFPWKRHIYRRDLCGPTKGRDRVKLGVPMTVTEVRNFLSLVDYNHWFVERFFNNIMRKRVSFVWDEKYKQSF